MENIKGLVAKAASYLTMLSLIATGVYMIVQFKELPGQLKVLEDKVSKLEKTIETHETKITLNDKRIDQQVLNKGVEDIFKN